MMRVSEFLSFKPEKCEAFCHLPPTSPMFMLVVINNVTTRKWEYRMERQGERNRASETTSPEEALAAFARQGIEVVTLRQISTHTAGSGLLVFCHLPVLVPFSLPHERFSDGLHSSSLLTHSHLGHD